jgi:hypothetical protein
MAFLISAQNDAAAAILFAFILVLSWFFYASLNTQGRRRFDAVKCASAPLRFLLSTQGHGRFGRVNPRVSAR